ncbi:MAG: four helix bundle protein [Anaerolineae bacterium]|nr:four helix bundle protein [Anaerolineae bacterium]
MAGVQRFEELIAWQKARTLAKEIYTLSRVGDFARDFGLSGQIQRAAVSIMSNIAEGFERNSNADFHRFLVIAKASCAELRSQLYIAHDIGYIHQSEFDRLLAQAEEVARTIGGLRASLNRRKA